MRVSILAIGSEILDGRIIDTNSQYFTQKLSAFGIAPDQILVCDDNTNQIVAALTYLTQTASHIIVTGGLGPTTDDVTREAIASFCKIPLCKDDASLHRLKKRFEERKRFFDPLNEKQCFFPHGAAIIPNLVGTAEGFAVGYQGGMLFSVPGVPKEMYPMFEGHILPVLAKALAPKEAIFRKTFKLFGIPEATVGRKIQSLGLPDSITVSYRAAFPEIHIVLKGLDATLVTESFHRTTSLFGPEYIFTEDPEISFPVAVCSLLQSRQQTVSVAESCTGGMLGMHLTAQPGSSTYFLGGFLSYSNALKESALGVPHDTIAAYGAVSTETAKAMAQGARFLTGSSWGISITGIAGPDGGTHEKPVGTFCIGISSETATEGYPFYFPSDRTSIRKYASFAALDVLRRTILTLPVIDYSTSRD